MSEKTQYLVDEITLDIDLKFEHFRNTTPTAQSIRERVMTFSTDDGVQIRESASGRTHIRFKMNKPVSIFEHFLIRAYCGDDVYRICMDLSRFYMIRDESAFGRLFDAKYSTAGKRSAGEWIDWSIEKARNVRKIIEGS